MKESVLIAGIDDQVKSGQWEVVFWSLEQHKRGRILHHHNHHCVNHRDDNDRNFPKTSGEQNIWQNCIDDVKFATGEASTVA